MTEFALVLPIFAVLLFGLIDFSRYVFLANALNNGAREGARFASVSVGPPVCTDPNPDLNKLQCAEEAAYANSWGQARGSMDASAYCQEINADGDVVPALPGSLPASECIAGTILTVTTEAPFSLLTPIVGQFIGPFEVAGEARVTVNS
jgi:hypothetical protein